MGEKKEEKECQLIEMKDKLFFFSLFILIISSGDGQVNSNSVCNALRWFHGFAHIPDTCLKKEKKGESFFLVGLLGF